MRKFFRQALSSWSGVRPETSTCTRFVKLSSQRPKWYILDVRNFIRTTVSTTSSDTNPFRYFCSCRNLATSRSKRTTASSRSEVLSDFLDIFADRGMDRGIKTMIVHRDPQHPAHAEIPVIIPQMTPRDQMPGIPIIKQADWFHLPERDFLLLLGTILQVDNLFVHNRLLQCRQELLRATRGRAHTGSGSRYAPSGCLHILYPEIAAPLLF